LPEHIPPIDLQAPRQFATATLAMGCFWGPDGRFGVTPGVIRTRVGYAGGSGSNPTYENIGNFIETVQIDYDPNKISFEEILEIFWHYHTPTNQPLKRQYTSALFFHDEEQEKMIRESKLKQTELADKHIFTEIIPFDKFYYAEDYHQKYRLRQIPELLQEFNSLHPKLEDFINSTAAARVNGYAGGYGSIAQLNQEINDLGMTSAANEILIKIVNDLERVA